MSTKSAKNTIFGNKRMLDMVHLDALLRRREKRAAFFEKRYGNGDFWEHSVGRNLTAEREKLQKKRTLLCKKVHNY